MEATKHRGRIQVQGGGVEESIPWTRGTPPNASEGHDMLNELHARLTPLEQRSREVTFTKAHEFIDRVAKVGGAHHPVKKTFLVSPGRDNRRIDIEVIIGLAFVPDAIP